VEHKFNLSESGSFRWQGGILDRFPGDTPATPTFAALGRKFGQLLWGRVSWTQDIHGVSGKRVEDSSLHQNEPDSDRVNLCSTRICGPSSRAYRSRPLRNRQCRQEVDIRHEKQKCPGPLQARFSASPAGLWPSAAIIPKLAPFGTSGNPPAKSN